MFYLFKFHMDSLDLYWRVSEKTSIKEATKEIEEHYKTKLNFIEGIK
tara:strand:+ start:135 stop:275 length:141 start_codon:yes stop_codon:yes gene_type:complete